MITTKEESTHRERHQHHRHGTNGRILGALAVDHAREERTRRCRRRQYRALQRHQRRRGYMLG
jgi:hypothetical protein